MVGKNPPDWQNRAHFFGVAARLMREILVDRTRNSGPPPVNITGLKAGTATLTIATTLGQTQSCAADNRVPRGIPWYTGGSAVLACVLLFGIPARRRRWRMMVGMAAFLVVVLTGGMLACGGGGGKGCVAPTLISAGTRAGAYTITVTGTSGTTTATGTVTLNVQ